MIILPIYPGVDSLTDDDARSVQVDQVVRHCHLEHEGLDCPPHLLKHPPHTLLVSRYAQPFLKVSKKTMNPIE